MRSAHTTLQVCSQGPAAGRLAHTVDTLLLTYHRVVLNCMDLRTACCPLATRLGSAPDLQLLAPDASHCLTSCSVVPLHLQDVAERIAREARQLLFAPRLMPMDAYEVSELPREGAAAAAVLFVVSTAGQGEFPDNARSFWR